MCYLSSLHLFPFNKRQMWLFLWHYPRSNKHNKQTIKQTKDLKPHKCSKTKKGASSLALLKIDLPWMTVCMPQKTDVAVSVALPMNFAFFMMPQSWRFEALSTLLTLQIPLGLSNLSQLYWAMLCTLGLIEAVHVILNFDENGVGK